MGQRHKSHSNPRGPLRGGREGENTERHSPEIRKCHTYRAEVSWMAEVRRGGNMNQWEPGAPQQPSNVIIRYWGGGGITAETFSLVLESIPGQAEKMWEKNKIDSGSR